MHKPLDSSFRWNDDGGGVVGNLSGITLMSWQDEDKLLLAASVIPACLRQAKAGIRERDKKDGIRQGECHIETTKLKENVMSSDSVV